MIKSVIFDMDGVLVDSEPVICAAAIAGLREFGVQAQPEDFLPFVGAGENKYIGGVAEKYGTPYRLDMKDRVYALYVDMVEENLGLYAEALPTLHKLRADGYTMAVASSADSIKVNANLRTAKIDQSMFETVISGEKVENKKPDPEIYLLAAQRLGTPPSDCVVIEDAVNGIQAGKAAGMLCIGLTTSFSEDQLRAAGADYICADIGGIYQIIRSINS